MTKPYRANALARRDLTTMLVSRLAEKGLGPLETARVIGAEVETVDEILSDIQEVDATVRELLESEAK
ncbi:MAG: hypothetical protein AAFP81_18530 [Pseudomonadota bacterium]